MSTSDSIPPRDVYTPPSPKRTDFPGQPSPERDPLYRDPLLDGNNRMMTEDYTPIEKMWQRLFEADGQPLPRLGQLLRGLALHLVRTQVQTVTTC